MATKEKTHSAKYTKNHDIIRKWVESRGGHPASVASTAKGSEAAGLLRIDFPKGASDPPLQPISWQVFFDKFDEEGLVFLYQEEKADGEPSTFCKFISRESLDRDA